MFGFFKKKEAQPPPYRSPSPFLNDGNPIHQAIIGLKNGDSTQVKKLLIALGDNPIILPMAKDGDLRTGATLMFAGAPHLAVYTRREFITNENATEYPFVHEIKLSKVSWALPDKLEIGVLINPGHPEVGVPITPPIFKMFRDAVEDLRPPLHCVANYPTPGENGAPWAPALDESDPILALMTKLRAGDETQTQAVFSALTDRFLTLPLKEKGRLESALVIRVKDLGLLVCFTRPEYIDQAPAAKDYPYRVQLTLRQICLHLVAKNPALMINPRNPGSVAIIPRLFPQLRQVVGATPPPFFARPPSLPPLPTDTNPIHRAIHGMKMGDKTQLFHLFDALVTTPVYVTLAEEGRLETCGADLVEGDTCIAVFTRSENIGPELRESHPYIIQTLVHQILANTRGNSVGITINPRNPHVGLPLPPAAVKMFYDAVLAGSPVPVLAGLYYVGNDDGTFSVLKILKLDNDAVHIRQYSNQYSSAPSAVDESSLYMLGLDRKPDEKLGVGHLPISKNSFAGWDAIFFQQSTVNEEELEGYRMWLEAKDGYF